MNASLSATQYSVSPSVSPLSSPSSPPSIGRPLAWLQQVFVQRAAAATPQHQVHKLEAGDTIEVADPLHHELVCLHGSLWITHDHLPADTVVERGQHYLPRSGSRMLVSAISAARLMVSTLPR